MHLHVSSDSENLIQCQYVLQRVLQLLVPLFDGIAAASESWSALSLGCKMPEEYFWEDKSWREETNPDGAHVMENGSCEAWGLAEELTLSADVHTCGLGGGA